MNLLQTYIHSRLRNTGAVAERAIHLFLQEWMHRCLPPDHCYYFPPANFPSLQTTGRKTFQMKNQRNSIPLHGKALCLLKTQFAKKPKNPV